jgi:queuosine precursor transporter
MTSATLLLAWIIGVTSFTLFGSLYVRRYQRPDLLIGLYVAFVLTAQLLATKIAHIDLGWVSFSGPAGVLVFAVTYLFTDIVNEQFGRRTTIRMIVIALFAQIAMTFFLWLGTLFPADSIWASTHDETAWNAFFGAVPRITVASWIAFLISESVDAYIFAWFKKVTGGAHLWMRNVFSTIPALAVDSLLFVPLAFYGVPGFPLWTVMKGQIMLKWIVGIINIPFMYLNHAMMTRGIDTPDKRVWDESTGE